MSRIIIRLMSLKNLSRANRSGQIATILIVVMVAMLMFVLATVNIGKVGETSTRLSNAADAAALQLASALSAHGRMLYTAKGIDYHMEVCKKRGLLAMIFGAILAIIAIVLIIALSIVSTPFTGGGSLAPGGAAIIMIVGIVAGAVGGMIGAAIDGTPIGQGALMGAEIGFAIGSIACGAMGGLGSGGAEAGSGGSDTFDAGLGSEMQGMCGTMDYSAGLGSSFAPAMCSSVGGISGAAAAGGNILSTLGSYLISAQGFTNMGVSVLGDTGYRGTMDYINAPKAYEALAQELNKLDERTALRESTYLTILNQVVDDPNKVQAKDKSGQDWTGLGTNAAIPQFLERWHERVQNYKPQKEYKIAAVTTFINQAKSFRSTVDKWMGYKVSGAYTSATGILERADYKWKVNPDGTETAVGPPDAEDGTIAAFLRNLYYVGQTIPGTYPPGDPQALPYWLPGPTPDAMNQWATNACVSGTSCGEWCDPIADPDPLPPCTKNSIPAGYDNFDNFIEDLDQVTASISEIVDMGEASATWETWLPIFYLIDDPSDPDTYYNRLQIQIDYLQSLQAKIVEAANRTPVCIYGEYTTDPNGVQSCTTCTNLAPTTGVPLCSGCAMSPVNPGNSTLPFGACRVIPFQAPCAGAWCPPPPPAPPLVVTIDENPYSDELQPAIDAIQNVIDEMQKFRDQIKQLGDAMTNVPDAILDQEGLTGGKGNGNPLIYTWKDSRNDPNDPNDKNQVTAVVSFAMPSLQTKNSWGKSCVRIIDYDNRKHKTFVTVQRNAPSKEVGPFGTWNPFKRPIIKKSMPYYTFPRGKVIDQTKNYIGIEKTSIF